MGILFGQKIFTINDGEKLVENIKCGDLVVGLNGSFCRVLDVSHKSPRCDVSEVQISGTPNIYTDLSQNFILDEDNHVVLSNRTTTRSHIEYIDINGIVEIDEDVAAVMGLCASDACYLTEKDIAFTNADNIEPYLRRVGHKFFGIKPDLFRGRLIFRSDIGYEIVEKIKSFNYKPVYGLSRKFTLSFIYGFCCGQNLIRDDNNNFFHIKSQNMNVSRGVYSLCRSVGIVSIENYNMDNCTPFLPILSVKNLGVKQYKICYLKIEGGVVPVEGIMLECGE